MLSNFYLQAFFHCITSPQQLTATTINLSIIIPHKSPHLNARKISKKTASYFATGTNIQDSLATDKKIIHFLNHRSITLTGIRYLLISSPLQSSLPLPSTSTFPLWKTNIPEDGLPDAFPLSHPASPRPPHEPDMPLCLIFQFSTGDGIALYDSLSYNSAKADRIFQPVPRADPPANPPQDTTVRLFPHTIFHAP